MTPRGIRNKNPGNIRHGQSKWVGMSPNQLDSAFVTFTSHVFGLRAMTRLLWNYRNKYGDQTVEELISRWAPSNENNTRAYVSYVAGKMEVDPSLPLDFKDPRMWLKLLPAIVQHENGMQPYEEQDYIQALNLAGIRLDWEKKEISCGERS